ncbi:MAG: hypothetical protein LKJ25_04125 [Clostridia bacterium]|jgi:hypothetical protein|nr:hypothetical protein [Clostridia bacterium]
MSKASETKNTDDEVLKTDEKDTKTNEVESQQTEESTEVETNPWKKKYKIKLFKDNKDYKDDVFVSVNFNSYQIKRGVEVEVPEPIYEALENSYKQDLETADLIENSKASEAVLNKLN